MIVAWLAKVDRAPALDGRKEAAIGSIRETGFIREVRSVVVPSGLRKLLCNTFVRTIGRFSMAMAWL
jgi:hypothetical protein